MRVIVDIVRPTATRFDSRSDTVDAAVAFADDVDPALAIGDDTERVFQDGDTEPLIALRGSLLPPPPPPRGLTENDEFSVGEVDTTAD